MSDDPFFDDDDEDLPVVPQTGPGIGRQRRNAHREVSVPWVKGHGGPLEPVMVEQLRECHFKAKPCALCGLPKSNVAHHKRKGTCLGQFPRGCANCGGNKGSAVHVGAPGSYNAFGSSANPHAWQGDKKRWEEIIGDGLEAGGLPKGLGSVLVEVEMCFGDNADRDQGNFEVVIKKSCGDVLQDRGWLHGDDWLQYQMGAAERIWRPGENWTRFFFFPSWERRPKNMGRGMPVEPVQGTLL